MADLKATDRGHQEMLAVYFQAATAPSDFYVALVDDTVVGDDDWADISGNELQVGANAGYAQVTIDRSSAAGGWPTLAEDDSEMQIESKKCTFTATGNWGTNITAVAVVANMAATDRLLLYANISAISVLTGESVSWTIKYKLTK